MKCGNKHIILKKIYLNKVFKNTNSKTWEELIKSNFTNIENEQIYNFKHINTLKLINYSVEDNRLELTFSTLLYEWNDKRYAPNKIIYPIFVNIDLDSEYIEVRAKSKKALYYILTDNDKEELGESFNLLDLSLDLIDKLSQKLSFAIESDERSKARYKEAFYNMMKECAETPSEIAQKVNNEQEKVDKFLNEVFNNNNIDLLVNNNFIEARNDILNIIEKYISINTDNKEIFTSGRFAFPIKISATDRDLSSVEASSLNKTPLQCTPIFFDNKKMMDRKKQCDRLSLMVKRKKRRYYSNDDYYLRAEFRKGICLIQFTTFVLEEEIQDVLSRIKRS